MAAPYAGVAGVNVTTNTLTAAPWTATFNGGDPTGGFVGAGATATCPVAVADPLCNYQSAALGPDFITIGAATYSNGTAYTGGFSINGGVLGVVMTFLYDGVAPTLAGRGQLRPSECSGSRHGSVL